MRTCLRNCDLSILEFRDRVCEFIKDQALSLPADESTRNFLNLHVEFMCFVGSSSLSIDLSNIKVPKLSHEGGVMELAIKIFGSSQPPPHTNAPLTLELAQELFNCFVLPNLVHLCEMHPLDHGVDNYQDMLLKYTAVLKVFRLLLELDKPLYKVLLHSFILPVVDDCLNNIDKVSAQFRRELVWAVEFFVVSQIQFMFQADQLDHIRPIVDMAISKLSSPRVDLQSSQVSVILQCLSDSFGIIAFDLDYKSREVLFNSLLATLKSTINFLVVGLDYSAKKGDSEDKEALVVPFETFARAVLLSRQIITKTFVFLSQDVGPQ